MERIVYDITGHMIGLYWIFLQPVSGPYDDSFEKLNLEADGWRSKG